MSPKRRPRIPRPASGRTSSRRSGHGPKARIPPTMPRRRRGIDPSNTARFWRRRGRSRRSPSRATRASPWRRSILSFRASAWSRRARSRRCRRASSRILGGGIFGSRRPCVRWKEFIAKQTDPGRLPNTSICLASGL